MTIRVVVADDEALVREGLVAIVGSEPDLEVVGTAADAPAPSNVNHFIGTVVTAADLGEFIDY